MKRDDIPVEDAVNPDRYHQSSTTPLKTTCVLNVRGMPHTALGEMPTSREYDISHTTRYEYDSPVKFSTHRLRLKPEENEIQFVESSLLELSQPGKHFFHEDVFGNQCVNVKITSPYHVFEVVCRSRVKVYAREPDDYTFKPRQVKLPMGWMPWQRQMMLPYLLPPELPETQLHVLTDYAKSFLSRNHYHLIDTIYDINQHIHQDYLYVAGETTLTTTPYDVFQSRRGVCQDFTNLFICLMRLLDVPARYRVGYIYGDNLIHNQQQAAASHAWAEIYIPYVGWRGFDPTNGCEARQNHIRVAVGRNYFDATPTAGTIFDGGGHEQLSVFVDIQRI